MKNKKVVITGGLGFIGSHLVEELNKNNEIIIIDDQSSGTIENIKDLDISKIDTTLESILHTDLEKIFEECDYVFHLAAQTSVPKSVDDPINNNEINVNGTLRVLDAAKKTGIKKVVFSSSSAVYGETKSIPINEKTFINPISPYAVSKATGELYCKAYSQLYDLSTISLRYFNVFGSRQDPNSQYAAVIPIFINKMLNNDIPIIYGDGEQTRDFVSVKDVVNANIIAAKSKKTGEFNIGLGIGKNINDLLKIIENLTRKNIKPIYKEGRYGDIKHSIADISKAKKLGYKPENNFKKELIKTINWFAEKNK